MVESTGSPAVGSAVVAASMDGVGILEEGAFVTANEELAATFGYDDPDALVGLAWGELYPPDERERIEDEVLPGIREGDGWRGEVAGVGADGSTVPHVLSVSRAGDGRLAWVVRGVGAGADVGRGPRPGPGVAGNGAQHAGGDRGGNRSPGRVEPRAVDSEGERFPALVDAAPVPMVVFTAGRGIVYANRRAVELVGGDDRSDVLGQEPARFVHPEHRDRARERVRRVVERREPTEPTEYRLRGLDDEERYVELAATPVTYDGEPAAYVVVNDVTSYRRAQDRLRRERRFIETVIDAIDDVFYVIDEDGEPYLWNETLVETTGYSHEEIEGMRPAKLLTADQREYVPGLMEAIDAIEDRRVELDLRTKDGETVPHEFRGTTFEDPETGEVFRCGLARDVTERRERERRLERYETIVETIDDGVYALDEDLRFSFVNEGLCEMLGLSREQLLGRSVRGMLADDERGFADEVRRRLVESDSETGSFRGRYPAPDGERIFESRYRLHPEPDEQFRGSVGVVRDVTARERRKRDLEHRLDELETLDRINRTLLETTRELVRTADRELIERTICTQLAESDLYRFVWIGEREFDGDRIVARTTAGDDDGLLDAMTTESDGGPVDRAMRTGDVQVATVDDSEREFPERVAGECPSRSVAAVPLHHEGTVYGVLVVHTARDDAFSDRERASFDVLGRTVGFVVNAVRSHKLLFTDAVVELEFRLTDGDAAFVDIAAELDCELALAGHVASGRRWLLYFEVTGAPPADVAAAAADDSSVERARVVGAGDGEQLVELTVTAPSVLHTVSHAGASVRTVVADPDGARLVVEAPVDGDVRDIARHVRSAYPGAELLGQHDRDREVTTAGPPEGVLGRLTDRQREVLEAAYRAGYFAWPRESTANELAASLDLASATVHGHLRKAEENIFSTLFDDE